MTAPPDQEDDTPLTLREMEQLTKPSEGAAQDCRTAGPGRGKCDKCAAGLYEQCRYTTPRAAQEVAALVARLRAQADKYIVQPGLTPTVNEAFAICGEAAAALASISAERDRLYGELDAMQRDSLRKAEINVRLGEQMATLRIDRNELMDRSLRRKAQLAAAESALQEVRSALRKVAIQPACAGSAHYQCLLCRLWWPKSNKLENHAPGCLCALAGDTPDKRTP